MERLEEKECQDGDIGGEDERMKKLRGEMKDVKEQRGMQKKLWKDWNGMRRKIRARIQKIGKIGVGGGRMEILEGREMVVWKIGGEVRRMDTLEWGDE